MNSATLFSYFKQRAYISSRLAAAILLNSILFRKHSLQYYGDIRHLRIAQGVAEKFSSKHHSVTLYLTAISR